MVFSSPVDGWVCLLGIHWSHVAEGRALHSCFHGLPASSQLPAHRPWSFPPRKEQLSLSESIPHLDQPLGIHCGFSALQHLGTFLQSQKPSWEQCSICVLTVTACGPETLSQTLPLSHMVWIIHLISNNPHSVSPSLPLRTKRPTSLPPRSPTSYLVQSPAPLPCLSQWSCRMISTSSHPTHGEQ